jgi:hypothetical protein
MIMDFINKQEQNMQSLNKNVLTIITEYLTLAEFYKFFALNKAIKNRLEGL